MDGRAACRAGAHGRGRSVNVDHETRAMLAQPWAILPTALQGILNRIEASQPPFAAVTPRSAARQPGAIAVLPLMGIIHQRRSAMEDMFGISIGTSTEAFAAQLRAAVADPAVKAIVIDADSPGGTVPGVRELADEVRKARAQKPVIAVADSVAASAAYWIVSQATEIVVSPSAMVGAVHIIGMHVDLTAMAEKEGVKVTLISAGKYGAVGHEMESLTEETRALLQGQIDSFYNMYVAHVARGRGVTPAAVRAGFGEGYVVTAKEAVTLGMADRVGTLRETLVRLGMQDSRPDARAEVE